MGQVHQIRSRAETGNLAEIITSVCSDIVGPDPRLELEIDADPIIVPSQKAAVVALIVNELVTNAVKHAFRDCVAGIVAVSLRRVDGDSVKLTVADNGAPLPMNGQGNSIGFGLNLVARFADQLAGALKVEAEPKRFSIVFPVPATWHFVSHLH